MKLAKDLENNDIEIDEKRLFTERTFICAMTRYGKSYCIRKVAEESFGKVGIIIIDPEGEYVSLRKNYPFLIIGKDIPLNPDTAEFIAEMVLKENLSVIIDSSTSDTIDEQEFVKRFIDKFMDLQLIQKKSYLIMVEEADEFCLPIDTEILTIDGWKKYNEIKEGIKVLTLNTKKDKLEYNLIEKVIKKSHNGNLVQLKGDVDIRMTPEHRTLIQVEDRNYKNSKRKKKNKWKNYEYKLAQDLPTQFRIPVARNFSGKIKKYSDEMIKLFGFLITDGHIQNTHKGKYKYVGFTQSHENYENIVEMKNILNKLGFDYSEYIRTRDTLKKEGVTTSEFYIKSEYSKKILKIAKNDLNKIPEEMLMMSNRQLRILYDYMMRGDGTKQKYYTRISKEYRERDSAFYPGLNKNLADQFQILCLKIGIRAYVTYAKNNQWRVNVSEKNPNINFKKQNKNLINYKGIVWCVRTKNGNFIARRNGKPFVTGNCPEKGVFKAGSLRSMINLAKKGAKRGIGVIFASQRPAMISKVVLSQCANQIIGHTEWSGDLKVLKEYLRIESSIMENIATSKQGEFYFKGNFIEEAQILKINEVKTIHLGDTPKLVPPTTKELKEVISKFSITLPKVIEEKLRPNLPDIKIIEKNVREKIEKEFKTKVDKLNTELMISKKQEVPKEEIENIINERVKKEVDEYQGKFQEQEVEINTLQKFINSIVSKGKQILGEKELEQEFSDNPVSPSNISYDVWLNKFQGGNKVILELMIKYKKLTKSQIIIMSGYKLSNLNAHVFPKLRKAGLIKYDSENVVLVGS